MYFKCVGLCVLNRWSGRRGGQTCRRRAASSWCSAIRFHDEQTTRAFAKLCRDSREKMSVITSWGTPWTGACFSSTAALCIGVWKPHHSDDKPSTSSEFSTSWWSWASPPRDLSSVTSWIFPGLQDLVGQTCGSPVATAIAPIVTLQT